MMDVTKVVINFVCMRETVCERTQMQITYNTALLSKWKSKTTVGKDKN